MTAIADPFELVDNLEQLREELLALEALDEPAQSRNELDEIADEAARVASAAVRAADEVRQAQQQASRQHDTLRQQTLDRLLGAFNARQAQIDSELRARTANAASNAERTRAASVRARRQRLTRLALWLGPACVVILGFVAALLEGEYRDAGDFVVPIVCAGIWGGVAEALYRYLRRRAAATTPRGGPDPRWATGRPGVAAACSAVALVVTPIAITGACIVIPLAVIAAAIYFSDKT